MNPKKIAEFLESSGEPPYRAKQVLSELCSGKAAFEEITTLPKSLRQRLSAELSVLSAHPAEVYVSKDGRAHKARMSLADGKMIETVLMGPKPGLWSVCVSSQVGCALKCSFCATGLMGFARNLTPEEIWDQVLFWRQYMRLNEVADPITNVVFMGMGEPMLNFDAVKESIRRLSDPELFGLGRRSISVSTVGIVPGIERFAQEMPQVNLALSLHAANDKLRERLVPINKKYPLEALKKSLANYFEKNNRKVFLEYVLLAGENDQEVHAKELVAFIKSTRFSYLLHVNLIIWNPTQTPHAAPASKTATMFRNYLINRGLHATIRKNLGTDIAGACGQLAINEQVH